MRLETKNTQSKSIPLRKPSQVRSIKRNSTMARYSPVRLKQNQTFIYSGLTFHPGIDSVRPVMSPLGQRLVAVIEVKVLLQEIYLEV